MSTASVPKKKPYVGMREYIAYQLEKVRGRLKVAELALVLMSVATLLGGYVLLFVILDHWVFDGGVPAALRIVASSIVLGGAAVLVLVGVVVPCAKRVSALYAARQIERADPKLKGTLLSLVDLERAGRPVPPSIVTALQRRVAAELANTDVDEAVDRTALIRVAYSLLAVVVLWCAYTVLSPKRIGPSLWRALIPTAPIQPATRTELYRIEPGDTEVIAGTRLPVAVDLRGEVPEEVTLLFTTEDGRFVDEPVVLKEEEPGLKRFVAILQGPNGRGLEQDITYRIVAGDARSREFHVTVLSPPKVSVVEVEYRYPEYMGLSPRTRNSPAIDAWEGTEVTIRADSSTPLKSALLVLSDAETTEGGERIPMRIEAGTKVSVTFPLAYHPDGTAPKFYRIECESTKGYRNPQPAFYPLNIRRDEPPEVRLLDPSGDLTVAANAIVPLAFAARDPDFRLRSVRLFVTHDGRTLRYNPFLYRGNNRRIEGQFDLSVARLNLRPGDRAVFWLQAEDNREPDPNRARTPKFTLTVTDLIPSDQKQQELAERRARQAERLEQLREQLEQEWGEELPIAEEPMMEPAATSADQPPENSVTASEAPGPRAAEEPAPVDGPSHSEAGGSDVPDRTDAQSRSEDVAGTPSDRPPSPGPFGGEGQPPQNRPRAGENADNRPRFANDGSDDQRILEELLRQQLAQRPQDSEDAGSGSQGQAGSGSQPGRSAATQTQPMLGQSAGRADGNGSPGSAAENTHADDQRTGAGSATTPPPERGGATAGPDSEAPKGTQDGAGRGASERRRPSGDSEAGGMRRAAGATPSAERPGANTASPRANASSGNENAAPSSGNAAGDRSRQDVKGGPDSRKPPEGRPAGRQAGNAARPDPKPASRPGAAPESSERSSEGRDGSTNAAGDREPEGGSNDTGSKGAGGDPKVSGPNEVGPREPPRAASQGDRRAIDGNVNGGERSPTDAAGRPNNGGAGEVPRSDANGGRPERPDARPGDSAATTGQNSGNPSEPGDRNGASADQPGSAKNGPKDANAADEQTGGSRETQGPAGGQTQRPEVAGGADANGERSDSASQRRSASGESGQKDPSASRVPESGRAVGERPGVQDQPPAQAGGAPDEAARPNGNQARRPDDARPRVKQPAAPAGEPCPDGMCRSPGNCPHCDTGGAGTSGKGSSTVSSRSGGASGGKSGSGSGASGGSSGQAGPSSKGGADARTNRGGSSGSGDGAASGGAEGGRSDAGAAGQGDRRRSGRAADGRGDEGQGGAVGQGGSGGASGQARAQGRGRTAGRKPGQGGGQPGGGPGGGSGQGASSLGAPPNVAGNDNDAAGNGQAVQPDDAPGGSGEGTGGGEGRGEPPNPEFAREATNLVLKRLSEQLDRGEVDRQLLERLGWTEDDLRRFLDRMSRSAAAADDDSPEARARRRQFEEMLKRVRPDRAQRERRDTRLDKTQIDTVTTRRVPVPPEYRELFEAYTKRLAKRRRR